MLSHLLFVVSLVGNHAGFVDGNRSSEVRSHVLGGREVGEATGGLVVKMGPVMNIRVTDVRVIPAEGELPAITRKGCLFEGFSKSRLYAVSYGK